MVEVKVIKSANQTMLGIFGMIISHHDHFPEAFVSKGKEVRHFVLLQIVWILLRKNIIPFCKK